jgi:hypothetical protein
VAFIGQENSKSPRPLPEVFLAEFDRFSMLTQDSLVRPVDHYELLIPIELKDRCPCFGQLRPKLFFAQEGVEKVIVRNKVARLVRGIRSWQAGQPGIECVGRLNWLRLSCLLGVIVQYGESAHSQMDAQSSEPRLPRLPSRDGALHDALEEYVIDAGREGGDVVEACLDKGDGCRRFPRGESGQSERVSTDIKSNHAQASSGEFDGFTTNSGSKHYSCARHYLVAREHVFLPLIESSSVVLRGIASGRITIAVFVVHVNEFGKLSGGEKCR